MIPTAREFLESKHIEGSENRCKAVIEFAKLHCIEQAKVISEKVCHNHKAYDKDFKINKDSILNAYSLDSIK